MPRGNDKPRPNRTISQAKQHKEGRFEPHHFGSEGTINNLHIVNVNPTITANKLSTVD